MYWFLFLINITAHSFQNIIVICMVETGFHPYLLNYFIIMYTWLYTLFTSLLSCMHTAFRWKISLQFLPVDWTVPFTASACKVWMSCSCQCVWPPRHYKRPFFGSLKSLLYFLEMKLLSFESCKPYFAIDGWPQHFIVEQLYCTLLKWTFWWL